MPMIDYNLEQTSILYLLLPFIHLGHLKGIHSARISCYLVYFKRARCILQDDAFEDLGGETSSEPRFAQPEIHQVTLASATHFSLGHLSLFYNSLSSITFFFNQLHTKGLSDPAIAPCFNLTERTIRQDGLTQLGLRKIRPARRSRPMT